MVARARFGVAETQSEIFDFSDLQKRLYGVWGGVPVEHDRRTRPSKMGVGVSDQYQHETDSALHRFCTTSSTSPKYAVSALTFLFIPSAVVTVNESISFLNFEALLK
mgnify:CR=1 FL=1